jgi:hypothetical protein
MKKKIFSLCFSVLILLSIPTFAQGPGEPYFPETANGAHNAYFQYQHLRWQNPIGTIYNEIFIHYDSSKVANMDPSSLYVSGFPATAFDSIRINQQLFYPTRYFWCVVEHDQTGLTQGDVWHFTTTASPIDFIQLDEFAYGLGKWTIENIGGCGWQISESSNYTLPPPATSKLLRADKNLCGGTINATATFQQVNNMQYMWFAKLEFNSDWKSENVNDVAKVEMRINGGYEWTTIWEKVGTSDRNKHISLMLFTDPGPIQNVQVRFKTSQYGTDSWWAVDDVVITSTTDLLSHFHAFITNVRINYSIQPKMVIKFQVGIPYDVRIERKTGLPTDFGNYQILDEFYSNYINTYIDSTIADSTTYTYRVGVEEIPINLWYTYSNEATGYVFQPIPVELINFSSEVIGSDVQLLWSTATETNNQGFEILRSTQNDNAWENIGFVPGFGTSTEVHHYSFVDESVQSGNYQYRLKQIDFDGTFEYSNILEVTIDAPTKFALEQNYPNPFNPTTKIKYEIPLSPPLLKGESEAGGFVTLKVYDVLGNEVATLVNQQKPAGTYEVEFNGTELPSGIYFYQLEAGSFIETKKMIQVK